MSGPLRRWGLLLAVVSALGLPSGAYANDGGFEAALGAGLLAFYARDFDRARERFDAALAYAPANAFALALRNATAANVPGELDRLTTAEEEALAAAPADPERRLRLAYSYLFAGAEGRPRGASAREAFDAVLTGDPSSAAAHVGLGILAVSERNPNRAKVEFLAALRTDPADVLAREYLSVIYQVDLKDPRRALAYAIEVPNLVPEYADILFHLASIFEDLHEPEPAITYATRGLELDIGHVGEAGRYGYTLLARIYLEQRRPADARRVLRAALVAGTDAEYAATLLRKLDAGDFGPPRNAR